MNFSRIDENSIYDSSLSFYLRFVWISIALSGIVVFEPAPYDILLTFLFLCGIIFNKLRIPKYIGKPLILLWLFLASNIISLFNANEFSAGVRYFLITTYLLLTWIFFVSFINSYRDKAIWVILSAYTMAAAISAVLGLLAYFDVFSSKYFNTSGVRLMFGFKDANVYGPFLVFVSLVALAKLESGKFHRQVLWLALFIAIITAIFLSFSRGAWLNAAIAFAVYIILRMLMASGMGSVFRRLLYVAGIILIAVLLIHYILQVPDISRTLMNRLRIQPYDPQRFHIQRLALSEILYNPLGIGPLQTRFRYSLGPHNLYIGVFIEYGIMGGFSFIIFVFATLVRALQLITKGDRKWAWLYPIFAASLLGLLANSLFIDSLHWRHLWLILAMPWAFQFSDS